MLAPNKHIESIEPVTHGGFNYAELSAAALSANNILDFSVNSNPYGPPPRIKKKIYTGSIDIYPDSNSSELVNALSEKFHIDPDHIIAGSGSTELIRMIVTGYFSASDAVLLPQPTYGEYELSCKLANTRINKLITTEVDSFKLNVDKLINSALGIKAKGIFLCNPNNPTGQYLSQTQVTDILKNLPDTMVILDEAYIAFTENAWKSVDLLNCSNLVILRSMTKDYALAGLRLGYLIASKNVISVLKKVKPPWNVSVIAQKAGIFSLNSDDYVKLCERKIQKAKIYLIDQLTALGLSPIPSQTNLFMLKIGDASKFRQKLLKKGILVRDCTSFGLPNYIRLSPRTLPECRTLIKAIKEIICQLKH